MATGIGVDEMILKAAAILGYSDLNNLLHKYLWSAVCVKTQDDAGIYDSCWYLHFMLVP